MIVPEKLAMATENVVEGNIEKIREVFPNCVTEFVDGNGKIKYGIDFDLLRQELSTSIVDGNNERYTFSWPNKKNAILLANAPTTNTLRPQIQRSAKEPLHRGPF